MLRPKVTIRLNYRERTMLPVDRKGLWWVLRRVTAEALRPTEPSGGFNMGDIDVIESTQVETCDLEIVVEAKDNPERREQEVSISEQIGRGLALHLAGRGGPLPRSRVRLDLGKRWVEVS